MSISNYYEVLLLDALSNGAPVSCLKANTYLALHIGDPGETGASNPASDTSRKVVTWANAAAGAKASNSNPTWASLAAPTPVAPLFETLTHWSLWDAAAAGNCLWTGTITNPRNVSLGDGFDVPSGSLILTLD